MFSGIIQAKGRVLSMQSHGDIVRIAVTAPRTWKFAIGQSIAIDGMCTTVVRKIPRGFEVELMPETIRKTIASAFKINTVVNLERSLRYGDFVDGHFVQGHVEGVAVVQKVASSGKATEITARLPKLLVQYIAPKGSIAINGVSLTVAHVSSNAVTVALIPHTLASTNLGGLKTGDKVNIETDMLARYLAASRKAV